VSIAGFSDRNLRVWLDPHKLEANFLTIADVVDSLQSQHVESAAGQFSEGKRELRVRWLGEAGTVEGVENIREQLLTAGYVEACPEEIADLVVVNSCSVTSDADKDSLYWVRRLRRENPQCRVAFTGCGAGTVPVEADWIIPSEKKSMLLDMISGCFEGGVVNKHEFHEQPIHLLSNRTRAFLKIQDGCDNVCSFCKIRIVRGKSRSRQMADIQEEAERKEKKDEERKKAKAKGLSLEAYRAWRDRELWTNLFNALRKKQFLGEEMTLLEQTQMADLEKKLEASGGVPPPSKAMLGKGKKETDSGKREGKDEKEEKAKG
jgi:hypothetical protein